MKQVAKVVIIDNEGKHLLLKRGSHPVFFDDPDLPGGTIEEGEEPLEAVIREVLEEAGIQLNPADLQHVYTGSEYSPHGTEEYLYVAHIAERPTVTLSWEHTSFSWLHRQEFLEQVHLANDTYMHMVYDVVRNNP